MTEGGREMSQEQWKVHELNGRPIEACGGLADEIAAELFAAALLRQRAGNAPPTGCLVIVNPDGKERDFRIGNNTSTVGSK